MIRISNRNSSHVLAIAVFIISAPMKNSRLRVRYLANYGITPDG